MTNSHALIAFFQGQPVVTLFLLLGFGYLLGRIQLAGFAFGPVAGTLLVSIALGQLGFRISAGAQAVGFALDPAGEEFSTCARLHRHVRARQHHFDDRRDLDPVRVNGDLVVAISRRWLSPCRVRRAESWPSSMPRYEPHPR